MARQTDYANIVREVFPAKLRAQSRGFALPEAVPARAGRRGTPAVRVAFGWQAIVVARRGELDGFQRGFRRGAADNEGDMVRRAGRGARGPHLLNQIFFSFAGVISALVS